MLLRASETHLGNLLDLQYGFSWPPVVESVVKGFLRDCEGIDNLTQYVARVLAFSDSEPSLADDLAVICRVVQYVLNREIALGESSLREARSQSRLQEIYEFHEVFAARLDSIIMRQGSHFTTDSASVCITVLYTILHITCSIPDSPAAAALSDYHKENPRLSGEQVCIALPYVWKLRALFTLIKCPQMQLRVFAATAMCRELVTFFNKLTPTPGADHSATHPLHAHIADFLHNENVVGYIVGSASHPEIIRHSQDVVGFLIATGTYRNKETDTIWAAVMDRQDSTLIEGLLQYLKYVAKSLDLAGLSYLCGKFMTLPSRAFSPSMRDVVMQCFTSLQKRCSDEGLPLPALPFEVCIRVIQETSQCFEHGISEVVDSQKWACQVLGDLNQYGPSDDDRQRLYSLLTQDIASKSTALSGSICALAKLLQHNSMSDLPALTAQYDLVGVLVDSLGHVSHDTTLSASSSLEQPIMRARHEFLLHIILKQPNTLLSPVGRRLWDTLVAAEDQSISAKEVAWKTLIMASKSEPQNAYLKLAFQEFLPELKPRHFTSGALTFTQTMVQDYLRHSFQATDDDVGQDTSGIEELWRMALTAPSASIEQRAISALVDLYFEGPLTQSRSLELVRSNHMKFVRRCIQQLAIAADMLQQLEHSSEGRRSDAKAPLDGAPLDESGAVLQEVIKFERSLELLTQFMKRYETWQAPQSGTRSRQQFSSPVNEEGEEIVIKYQAFEDQKHGPTCAISVGAGNTLMNLFNVIETATGFENFKVFHWGTEMSLQTCDPESLVVDHAIHQGLLLVVKRSGRWTDVIGHLGENSISEEVLSHFTDFRAYLGMRTTVAKAVYQFLISIPMSPKLSMALEQTHPDLDDILPVGQPFMCLYSIHGMQELLQSRKRQGLCDTNFLDRLLRLTISAISKKDFFDACDDSALRISMAQSLLDCLGQILQNTVPGPVPNPSFNEALLDSLFALNGISQLLNQDRSRQRLMSSVFDVLLEISFQNQTFLSAFNRHENTPLLLSALLLESSAPSIRKSTLKQLGKRCGQGQSPISASHHAMSLALWPLLYDLIPKSFVLPNQSEETFSAAILVFRNLAGSLGERYLQQQCFVRWCQFLLDHQSTEELYVGYPQDSVAKGLAHLAYLCTCFIKAPDTWLTQQKLGSELFKAHLFPPHSYATDVLGTGHTPILTSVTRNYIYDIVLYLTRLDRGQFIEVLALMSPLTTYDASNKRGTPANQKLRRTTH
jgi:ubiquitin carboxyl-terminal hydrolase 34